ncbi:hypothetical protein BDV27DRAFT_131496 [Aspergillus caelatus]|uniref:Uncharacterized protein n=1 Tax=Aspergillus caelatus TaxID=61420 RepID=A0A5N6ZYI4_9EURO|nr:uncharacterized protein BDV27DRAFT_131496 [Aspergillus caelatus]KAE8362475.1 hypothetical protein BDV27DRAFT_131496 [Aspergillus caelatus]
MFQLGSEQADCRAAVKGIKSPPPLRGRLAKNVHYSSCYWGTLAPSFLFLRTLYLKRR